MFIRSYLSIPKFFLVGIIYFWKAVQRPVRTSYFSASEQKKETSPAVYNRTLALDALNIKGKQSYHIVHPRELIRIEGHLVEASKLETEVSNVSAAVGFAYWNLVQPATCPGGQCQYVL